MTKRRPYLRWIHERGAVLIMPFYLGEMACDTPEAFHHNEMGYRSPLLERAVARGIPLKPPAPHPQFPNGYPPAPWSDTNDLDGIDEILSGKRDEP